MRENKKIPIKGNLKFALIVDGETEFWYFKMLNRNEADLSVDLKPEIPKKDKKLKEQYQKTIDLAKHYDKVFWIVDFDVIIKETKETPKGKKTKSQEFKEYFYRCQKNKRIVVIINNPCFEYWIYLHFNDSLKYFDSCEKAINCIKKELPDYSKTQVFYTKTNNDIYLKLKPYLKTAIKNTKNIKPIDFDNPENAICNMNDFFEEQTINKYFENVI